MQSCFGFVGGDEFPCEWFAAGCAFRQRNKANANCQAIERMGR